MNIWKILSSFIFASAGIVVFTFFSSGIAEAACTLFPGSQIATSGNETTVAGWLPSSKEGTLLYRRSTNGSAASTFHSLVDNQGETISLIKTTNNRVIGGYNPSSWSSNGSYLAGTDGFLFNLTYGFRLTNTNSTYMTYNNSGYGPCFGGGHDMCVSDSNTSTGYNNTHSYQNPSTYGYTYLEGAYSWNVSDIEVYKLSACTGGGGSGGTYRSTYSTSINGAGSIILDKPTGTVQNDVMVAVIGGNGNWASVLGITPPAGWTLIRKIDNSTGQYYPTVAVYYKVAGASEPSSYTFTFSNYSGGVYAAGSISSFYGVNTASPIDVENGQTVANSSSTTTSYSTPSITTSSSEQILIGAFAGNCSSSWTPPSGMTEIVDRVGGCTSMSVAYQTHTSGATGAKTATAASSSYGGAILVALKAPASASVATTGVAGYSYNYITAAGTLNNQTGNTVWYGARWGAGSGYSGTTCQNLPNSSLYSTVANGFNGSVQPQFSGLTASTLYYFCVYAHDQTAGQYYYSPTTSSYTTSPPQVPTMERVTKGEITTTTANITGNVAAENGASITAKGICYSSTNTLPAVSQGGTTCTSNGTGTGQFTANITGLTANTLYYFRAYSTNSAGSGYSAVDTFTTETTPPAGYPQIVSTTGLYDRNNSTTHNVVMPAVVDAGDLLIVITTNDGSATVTTPSGWTQLFTTANSTSLRLGAYYKFAAGTEDGTSVNFATSASEILTATAYRVTGALAVESGTAATGTSTTPNPPSLTPSWGARDTLWLSALGADNGSIVVSAYPTNYTNGRLDKDTYSSSTTYASVASARRYLNASSEDPGTFTLTGSNAWVANTIAIRPEVLTPSVTTDAASSVTQTTATLNGSTNPNGYATTGWFRYFTSNPGTCADSGGTRVPSSSGAAQGSGTDPVGYGNSITGLTPGTSYWSCAIASNTYGTGVGSPVQFTTAVGTPTTVTTSTGESGLGSYYVTLNGSANPNNFTSYGFFRLYESDPGSCTDSGGQRYPADGTGNSDQSLGSSASSQNFDYSISSGLDPDTTYYYCAFARNQYGTVGSSVDTFTTEDGAAGACDPPTAGSHTISGSCSYTSSVGGVDAGTGTNNTAVLTIGAGRTLTINAAQQVAWGSISMQGGASINLGSGGSLRRSPVWVIDSDGDGRIGSTEQYIGAQPVGGVRRNTVSNTYAYFSKILSATSAEGATYPLDCNDASQYAYRTINSLVTDADNDGYKTSAAASNPCVGDSSTINGRTYYKDASNVSSWLPDAQKLSATTDCYDNSAAPCPPTTPSVGSAAQTAMNNITWSATTGPTQTSYNLQWCSGSSCTPSTTISGVSSGYNHTGRTCNTIYRYRVIALNASGSSTASGIGQGTTSSCVNPPNVPNSPVATVDNPNKRITVSWSAPTGGDAPTGYYVYWCTGAACTPSTQINAGLVTSYQHNSLTCGGVYRYTISAYNAAGESSQTAVVQGTMNGTTSSAYTDSDNDGQRPSGYSTISICGTTAPSGYTSNTTPTDCYDGNANARVGQTSYFEYARGDGHPTLSYDYNCDNLVTKASIDACTGGNPSFSGYYYTFTCETVSSAFVACTSHSYVTPSAACGTQSGYNVWGSSCFYTDSGCTNLYGCTTGGGAGNVTCQ